MELHHKIVKILKQEFPELVLPTIQKGFDVAITVSIECLDASMKNKVNYLEFCHTSNTGDFTCIPKAAFMTSAIGYRTNLDDFAKQIQLAKSTGSVHVKAGVSFGCKPITK